MIVEKYDFFKKNNIKDFFKNQFLISIILIIIGIYLTKKKISPLYTIISLILLYFYSYFAHITFHLLPEIINPHLLHHVKKINIILNLSIEIATNVFFFIFLYAFQKLINITIIPNILILYYGIIYVSIHIVNYSIFENKTHENHHKNNMYNYGPDTMDHIFKTNFDNTWEDYVHILPNILFSYIICSYYV